VGEYASKALAAARMAGHGGMCASALIMLGNSRLHSATEDRFRTDDVPGDELPPENGKAGVDLPGACEAFDEACQHARQSGDTRLEAQALRLLGIALSQRISERGEVSLLERAATVLRGAATKSTDNDCVTAWLNLGNTLLSARRQGCSVSIDTIEEAIAEAERVAAPDINAIKRLEQLRAALEQDVLLDGKPLTLIDLPPQALWYRRYRTGAGTITNRYVAPQTVSLLLFPNESGAMDGTLRLSRVGNEVLADLNVECPACSRVQCFNLPIVATLQEGGAQGLAHVREMTLGQRKCSDCESPIAVQFAFTVHDKVDSKPLLIYPDVFRSNIMQLQGATGVAAHQIDLASQVDAAWTGRPAGAMTLMPWAGIPALGFFETQTLFDMQRTQALAVIILGLLKEKVELIRVGLDTCPALTKAAGKIQVSEVACLLDPLRNTTDIGETITPKLVSVLTDQTNDIRGF
jgi:hypothetical protein